ncbi:hypothetical protein CNMCM5623_009586 [Aspergillus felis]|uniref:Uncharacterized protein n=1 Tax=Aspergillus felis TaxID=1287682 RepID=A0A8H6Q1L9_9EURO|nr:hypothetical protein CNMCM5623_009586 [Aspergillus felis]
MSCSRRRTSLFSASSSAATKEDSRFSEEGEKVDTAIDEVGYVRFRLFDVVQHALGVSIGDNTSKVGGGLVADPGSQNHRLCVLLLEQLQHLTKREGAADVSVQDENALGLALEDGITEMIETPCCAKCRVFTQVLNSELGELLAGVFDEITEDRFIVVADQDDFSDIGNFGKSLEAVVDNGVTGNFEKGLIEFNGP